MFETDNFKDALAAAISTEAGNNNMTQYETSIVNRLQQLATENESPLMDREVRKVASERRGIPDAVNSARSLARDASKIAAAEGRTLLKLSDIDAAYRAKFCQFWPFCK